MDEKTGHRPPDKRLSRIWLKLADYFREKMREPEGGCGKCAVCHHVCQLLDKKPAPEE